MIKALLCKLFGRNRASEDSMKTGDSSPSPQRLLTHVSSKVEYASSGQYIPPPAPMPIRKKPRKLYQPYNKDDPDTYQREDAIEFDYPAPESHPVRLDRMVPVVGLSHSPSKENFAFFVESEGRDVTILSKEVTVKGKKVLGLAVMGHFSSHGLPQECQIGWLPADLAKKYLKEESGDISATIATYFPPQRDRQAGMRLHLWRKRISRKKQTEKRKRNV